MCQVCPTRERIQGIFVSGTDTGVGKTLVSALLLLAIKEHFGSAFYFKPIQTGVSSENAEDDDLLTVQRLTGAEFIQPSTYSFSKPAAPLLAAQAEDRQIDLSLVRQRWLGFSSSGIGVAEGAGGILVPLTKKETILDLVKILDLPLLLVASTRLGTINHILLTLEVAKSRGIPVSGIVLSESQTESVPKNMPENIKNRAFNCAADIEQALKCFTPVPIVARIESIPNKYPAALRAVARSCFPEHVLKTIL